MEETVTRVNDGLELIQKRGGHLFGTDAYLLYAFVRPAPERTAVELGAGCGIVSLLCAQNGKFAHIDAVEIQPEMAETARKNVALNRLSGLIDVCETDLRLYRGSAGAVFANPPYIKRDAGIHNPDGVKNVSRREMFGGLGDFAACASRILSDGGRFYCVWRPDRLTDLLETMRKHGIEPKRLINVYPEPGSAPCLVLAEGVKGAKPGSLYVTPPFILSDGGKPTAECNEVYERGEFGGGYLKP